VRYNVPMHRDIFMYTDGGARGNPGPAGAGAVIYKNKKEIGHVSKFLGIKTNNWAEYEALILVLEAARALLGSPVEEKVTVRMDSELIVRQMKGEYRVKNLDLKVQHQKVRDIIAEAFPHISFEHVPREENSVADGYANDAMNSAR